MKMVCHFHELLAHKDGPDAWRHSHVYDIGTAVVRVDFFFFHPNSIVYFNCQFCSMSSRKDT